MKTNKILSVVLALLMAFSVFPTAIFAEETGTAESDGAIVEVSNEMELRKALYEAPTDGTQVTIKLTADVELGMLYAAENFGTETLADNAAGDTFNRYKLGVHPSEDDPDHWNKLVTDQTQEQREVYSAYYHTSAGDERIARLVVKEGQNVVLDINGRHLKKADRATAGDWSEVCLNTIANYGTLEIKDSEGTGLISGNGFITCSPAVIQNYGGKLTIGQVMIDGGANGGTGQYVLLNGVKGESGYDAGVITLNGTMLFDDSTSASLVYNAEGALNVNAANDGIDSPAVLKNGKSVIKVKGGKVELNGVSIETDNKAITVEGGNVDIKAATVKGEGVVSVVSGTVTKADGVDLKVADGYTWSGNTLIKEGEIAKVNGTGYATLAEAIAAANDGDTVKLLADCSGDGIKADEDKFSTNGLTIDFDGHSYTVGGVLVGSSGTASNGFQLLNGNKITMRNGTIYGDASVAGDTTTDWSGAPAMIIQNYCDLTLKGMTVVGGKETCYTMSNNNGNVVIEDSTIKAGNGTKYGPFAFDVCRYSSYPSVSVTVKGNSVIEGDIEISGAIGEGQSRQLNIENGKFTGEFVISGKVPANIAISGGNFSHEIPKDYCAENYVPKKNTDGTYDVIAALKGTKENPYTLEEFGKMTRAEYIAAQEALGDTMYVDVGAYSYDKYGTLGNGERNDTVGQIPDHSKLNAYGENGYLGDKNDGANGKNVVFVGSSITSGATGYTSIDNIGTYLLLAVPAYTNVTFEGITFNNVMNFNYQLYTSPWSQLGSIEFKNCTFNGIIVGSIAAQTLAFRGCEFKSYTNTVSANNSNPTWIRPAYGNWTKGDNEGQGDGFKSLTAIIFENNTVTSTRPVKFERIAQWEMDTNVTVTGNNFDIEDDGSKKNVGMYFGANAKFDLVADNNTKSDSTAALYTAVYSAPNGSSYAGLPAGSTVKNASGDDVTLDANEWKSTNKLTLKTTTEAVELINSKNVSVKFATLADAIAAANDGDTVKLLADVEQNSELTVDKSITLDLSGKKIYNTVDIWDANATPVVVSLLSIEKGAAVTITGNGTIAAKDNDCYTFNVVDGNLTVENGSYIGNISVVQVEKGTLTVNGGSFSLIQKMTDGKGADRYLFNCIDDAFTAGDAKVAVSGGTFDGFDPNVSPEAKVDGKTPSFAAPGVGITKKEDGSFTAETGMNAQIMDADGNSVKAYATLADAIAAANDGETVKLLADTDISDEEVLMVTTNITLDLAGKALKVANTNSKGNITIENATLTLMDSTDTEKNGTGTGKLWTDTVYTGASTTRCLITASNNGHFVMESGLIDAASFTGDPANNGQFAIGVYNEDSASTASATVNGGHIKAGWYAIAGNGNSTNGIGNITVNGGIVESVADYAIYHPQNGTTTVNGGVIYGASGGILLNRGKLVVNDGLITSKGTGSTGTWGDGTGGAAAAAININAKYGDAAAEIVGGKVTAEANALMLTVNPNYKGTIAVSGGTFSNEVPADYCAEGYTSAKNADGTYTVALKPVVKKKLTVTLAGGYAEAAFNGTTEMWYALMTDEYAQGTEFTLTAYADSGYTFMYWVNADMRVVSDDVEYTFILGDKTELTAVFARDLSATNFCNVVFRDDRSDRVLYSKTVKKDTAVPVPAFDNIYGFEFAGWADKDGNAIEVVDGKITATGDMTVYAKFTAIDGFTITVNGTELVGTYAYGKTAKVTAAETNTEGKHFIGWYVGDTLVSYRNVYSFAVTGNVELVAKYGDAAVEAEPIVSFAASRTGDSNKQEAVMYVSFELPSGYELSEVGLVRTFDSNYATADTLTLEKVDGNNVKKHVSKFVSRDNGTYSYTLKLGSTSAAKTLYACGYLIFKNNDGKTVTIYTDVATIPAASTN